MTELKTFQEFINESEDFKSGDYWAKGTRKRVKLNAKTEKDAKQEIEDTIKTNPAYKMSPRIYFGIYNDNKDFIDIAYYEVKPKLTGWHSL